MYISENTEYRGEYIRQHDYTLGKNTTQHYGVVFTVAGEDETTPLANHHRRGAPGFEDRRRPPHDDGTLDAVRASPSRSQSRIQAPAQPERSADDESVHLQPPALRRSRIHQNTSSTYIPHQPYADDGGDGGASTGGRRTGIPKLEDDVVATPPTKGNAHRSIVSTNNTDEREQDSGRTHGRTRRRRSHQDAAVGHTPPRPIYSPAAQIRRR